MSELTWSPARITVDEGATVIDAEVRSDRWNGWLIPRMGYDAALATLTAVAEYVDEFAVHTDGDTFIVWEYAYEADPNYTPEIHRPTADGWYYVGAMAWTWETADRYEDKDAS